MTVSRILALQVLEDILVNNKKPKASMEQVSSDVDRRDRDFLMEMVYGVLRYLLTIDWILDHFLTSRSRLNSKTISNLRIALYQQFFMRVPEHAVVHEAVEIEKSRVKDGKPELVNAVLRNCLRQSSKFTRPLHIEDPINSISINTSHPRWLISRWAGRLGREEASALAHANNEIPLLTLRVNTLRISRDGLLEKLRAQGVAVHETPYSPDGISVEDSRSFGDLVFAGGLFIVQDEASQLISYLLNPRRGEKILDACAAPGGKTTHIAQLMGDSGTVVAVEIDRERASKVIDNVRMLGIRSVQLITGNVQLMTGLGSFDRILLDAPCSALGVIRRNPDVKYKHSRKSLREFSKKQLDLLLSMPERLAKNGCIVYSVCSTEPEEGEEVIEAFLKRNNDFRIINAEGTPAGAFQKHGFFRTYPNRNRMDGFFGVILCRKTYPFS